MRILIDIMFMFRGAYLALLIMGVYQFCFHVPIFTQSRGQNYHKSSFTVGLTMAWVAIVEIFWYAVQFTGRDTNIYWRQYYTMLTVMIPPFLYLTSHVLRNDEFLPKRKLPLVFSPFVLVVVHWFTRWDLWLWVGFTYIVTYTTYIYVSHLLWTRRHEKLMQEAYSDQSRRSVRWYTFMMLCFVAQMATWTVSRFNGSVWMQLIYLVVAIVVWGVMVFQCTRHQDHKVLTEEIEDEKKTKAAEQKESRPKKLSQETIDHIAYQLAKTEEEYLYLEHDVDASEYCDKMGTNHSYFSKYLNQQKGMTFYQYINNMRMRHVQEQLLNSDASLEDIAYECGYNDVRSFRRAFRECFNTTPTEYRERYRYTEDTKE